LRTCQLGPVVCVALLDEVDDLIWRHNGVNPSIYTSSIQATAAQRTQCRLYHRFQQFGPSRGVERPGRCSAKIRAIVFGTRQRTSVTTNEVVLAFNAQIQLVIVQKECQVRLNRGRDLIKIMLHPDRT
jgi:hypothetical protein